ncbi:hypothetical protein Pmani_014042 [Petrolisthes manimaculis]|uniref:Uncharacterized protein n=1 Tax=Petrolisthes manimaculis TaxID=1843537 RepID=A0AAE1U8R2_9EUCA|nr:hypothetical protein Pmani_014042 [Petrolisthes manimaculis]
MVSQTIILYCSVLSQHHTIRGEENPSLCVEENPSLCVEENPSLCVQENPSLCVEENPSLCTEENPSLCGEENPSLCVEENPIPSFPQPRLPLLLLVNFPFNRPLLLPNSTFICPLFPNSPFNHPLPNFPFIYLSSS